jgi:hypothetical protein
MKISYLNTILVCLISFLFCLAPAKAQVTGGQHVFRFLDFSPSARITALGGSQIAVKDDDVNLAALNPAALNPKMDGRLVFNHDFYLSDIGHGYLSYGKHLNKLGITTHAGLKYIKYGKITMADEYGNKLGLIKAAETAFIVGAGKKLTDRLSLGLNVKFANSTLDSYKSSAIGADIGFMYVDTVHFFSAGLVLRNQGAQLKKYNNIKENIPNDLQFGVSKKLRYLPFRLSIIAHHLQQWDIRYNDPNATGTEVLLFGEDQTTKKGNPQIDNFFRHLIFNGEFLLGANEGFRIRFGYNHLRKKELSVQNYRSLAGFSGGLGVKIKRFRIDMGYDAYHLAGGTVHFSFGTNLNEFFHKKVQN